MKNKAIEKAIGIAGSQGRLAAQCGVSQPTVFRWLNGGGMLIKNLIAVTKATAGKVKPQDLDPEVKELVDLMQ